MKSLSQYISEKLVIKKSNNLFDYKYFPETRAELRDIIKKRINIEGKEVNLNYIDTSKITSMSYLFEGIDFNGDISEWNVSNVTSMANMFFGCSNFNQDISAWDVSKVLDMNYMFYGCKSFNQDISNWDVSNVIDMRYMFNGCESFNQDISNWDISKVQYSNYAFVGCPIEEKYKPKFK